MIYVFSIPYPQGFDKNEFSGLFAAIEMEGLEEKEHGIDLYISEEQLEDGERFLREMEMQFGISYQKSELEQRNWNEQWESGFQPLQLDDFVLVRTTFHPENKTVRYQVIIEPKMSFGTGHHPTTAQMMQCMRLLDMHGKRVLDCGSGTGILAILAEKMGARSCVALDNDTWCFQNCLENILLNNCSVVHPELGTLDAVKDFRFDCILANIHRNFLLEYMHELASVLTLGGNLVVSGFYAEDSKAILAKALEHHLIANYHSSQNNWDCIVLQKTTL
jgi:ribosomal protein L11 methyltransferase